MSKKNCWEFKKCGRQMGGAKVGDLGECPAARCFPTHGVNRGINGGRACWAIAGTFCQGIVQGSFAQKITGCAGCDFFHQVLEEEGEQLASVQEIVKVFKKP